MLDNQMLHVDLRILNCHAEFYLNQIPLHKLGEYQKAISIPAQEYLVDGKNALGILIDPGPTPSQCFSGCVKKEAESIFVEAKLVRYPVGAFPGDNSGTVLGNIAWKGNPNQKETFPKYLETHIDMGLLFGAWAWQTGAELSLDEQTLKEAFDLVSLVHNKFHQGETKVICDLADIAFEEGARAYPQAGDRGSDLKSRFSQYLQENISHPGWTTQPLKIENTDFRLCAKGKMIEAIGKDWKPLVAGIIAEEDGWFPFPMFLSRINGQLSIVR